MLPVLITLLFALPVAAATITAASASRVDVGTAYDSASDGDTVQIPAGTASWTNYLSVSKSITLRGAGMGQTIIIDEARSNSTRNVMMEIVTTAGKSYRLSNLTIRRGTENEVHFNGTVQINGSSHSFRVDRVEFDRPYALSLMLLGDLWGVVDQCVFHNEYQSIEVRNGRSINGASYGDGSWATNVQYGTTNCIYIETCVFTNSGFNGAIDGVDGARFVFRNNAVTNNYVTTHGTDSSGRVRGVRAYELYKNTIVAPGNFTAFFLRSGTGLIASNTIIGASSVAMAREFKLFFPFWYGSGANGTNNWHSNNVAGRFTTGAHDGTNNAPLLIDSTASWTVNQWVGYSIQNTNSGNFNNGGGAAFGEILSNTATSITYTVSEVLGYGTNMTFSTGQGYAIYHVEAALDQVGRGAGDLLSGDPPTPFGWPNQLLDPVYAWSNTVDGALAPLQSVSGSIRENVEFYNDTAKPGWTPLVYPHPLAAVQSNPLRPPVVRLRGNVR